MTTADAPMPALATRVKRVSRDDVFALRPIDYLRVISAGLAQAACLLGFVIELRSVLAAFRPTAVGVVAEGDYHTALTRCVAMAGLAILLGIFRSWEFGAAERAGYEVVRRLRMEMYAHMQRMLPEHIQHRARGGLLLRLTGDLSMLRMWLSRGILQGISATIVLVAGVGIIFAWSPWLALTLIGVYTAGAALSLLNGAGSVRPRAPCGAAGHCSSATSTNNSPPCPSPRCSVGLGANTPDCRAKTTH